MNAFAGKVPHQVIPSLGGISAAEPLAVGLAEVATVQQLARGERLLGHQLGDEEFLRRLVGFEQACAFRTGVRGHVVGFVVMQFDMVFVGEQLHRVTKVDVLLMFDVAEHVAAETAAEAMPYAKRRAHGKNLGVFSSWKGHRPTYVPVPEGLSVTVADTMSYRSAVARTFSMSSFLIIPGIRSSLPAMP